MSLSSCLFKNITLYRADLKVYFKYTRFSAVFSVVFKNAEGEKQIMELTIREDGMMDESFGTGFFIFHSYIYLHLKVST